MLSVVLSTYRVKDLEESAELIIIQTTPLKAVLIKNFKKLEKIYQQLTMELIQ